MYISIALCTYNGEPYLKEQLESILNQSRRPDEVIICDDHSLDGTWIILEKFKKQASFDVRIVKNEKNLGSTANFAKAIELCSGDIIFLADQDDVWFPQKLEVMERVFEADADVSMVFTNAIVTDESLASYPKSLWEYAGFNEDIQKLCIQGQLWSLLAKKNFVTGATMAFRSKWKFLLMRIHTDWVHDEWITFVLDLVSKITFIPDKLIMYRLHQNQQIGVRIKERSMAVKQIQSIFPDRNRHWYKQKIKRMDILLKHVQEFSNCLRNCDMYDELTNQVNHWQTRYSLPKSPYKRWKIIKGELAAGRYRKYSISNRMAFKDFFV